MTRFDDVLADLREPLARCDKEVAAAIRVATEDVFDRHVPAMFENHLATLEIAEWASQLALQLLTDPSAIAPEHREPLKKRCELTITRTSDRRDTALRSRDHVRTVGDHLRRLAGLARLAGSVLAGARSSGQGRAHGVHVPLNPPVPCDGHGRPRGRDLVASRLPH